VAVGGILALVVALAVLVLAFLAGVTVPGEWLRGPIEHALSAAFGVPTRIEGPLQVRTGLSATASADSLVLADPSGAPGATLARGIRPAVRIDLAALARRVVALQEVSGERLELALARGADGRANWAPIFAASPGGAPPPVSFAGIERLRIGTVRGTYQEAGSAPFAFELAGVEGSLTERGPTTARGTARVAGHAIEFDLRSAAFGELQNPSAAVPLRGTLVSSGARIGLDGRIAADGSTFDAAVDVSADDADSVLTALGIPVRGAGALDARGKVRLTAADAAVSGLALKLGESAVSGGGRIAWSAPRTRLALDLTAERLDPRPFVTAGHTAPEWSSAEEVIEGLERLVAGLDAEVKVQAAEVAGLAVTLREVDFDARSTKEGVAARGSAVLAGTRTRATFDYDARKPQRALTGRIDGGPVSTGALPRDSRPTGVTGTLAGVRGQLQAQGATARELVVSANGFVEARGLRWALDRPGKGAIRGRFDRARLSVVGTRSSSVEVAGALGEERCVLKASGGAIGPLFEGKPWPMRLAASCSNARLDAQGPIAFGGGGWSADLRVDASAARTGPILDALGFPSKALLPVTVRGTLAVTERLARARLDMLRLGRTAGSGEVAFPLDDKGTPQVRLSLTNLNLDELNALGEAGPVPPDPLGRVVLPERLRLPEAEFDIAVDRVEFGAESLRRLHVNGVMHASRLPPARFAFEWEGVPVSGELAMDFRGARPHAQVHGTARNADLGPVLARMGRPGVRLRAGSVSVRASAEGERLGELLGSAALEAGVDSGRLELAERALPGGSRRADFSATLKATPGGPAALAARGTTGAEAFSLDLETPGLAGLARAGGPIPARLALTVGDARLEAAGRVARDGTGEGNVRLEGARADRLGRLVGIELPEVGPYAISGTVVAAAEVVRASDVDVSVGKSRIQGQLQARRGTRLFHSASLRAPNLHLEDLGAARWLRGPAQPAETGATAGPAARLEEERIARALDALRGADVDVTVEVDALHGGAERFASGRLRATLASGALRILLQDVRTESGTVDADIRIDATSAQPRVDLRARVDGLDFGPLARVLDPATKLGGRLDLAADLSAQGPPGRLIPTLSGAIDVAVFPHDLRPGGLDFWGTGLLSTTLRSLDPSARSEVECAAASLDVAAGVASTSAFFVDTTRVRIIGQIEADLATHALSGRLRPVSEQPELFTVAPTMLVGGTMEHPRVTVAAENVVLAPLRFATPLAGFALDFLSGQGHLRAAAVGCREAFERARAMRPAIGGPR
jgi:uncharacterized protein involved in outer membrane biogenesis